VVFPFHPSRSRLILASTSTWQSSTGKRPENVLPPLVSVVGPVALYSAVIEASSERTRRLVLLRELPLSCPWSLLFFRAWLGQDAGGRRDRGKRGADPDIQHHEEHSWHEVAVFGIGAGSCERSGGVDFGFGQTHVTVHLGRIYVGSRLDHRAKVCNAGPSSDGRKDKDSHNDH